MHLDSRGYAYETFREDGRVCRQYCGSGLAASLGVRLDQRQRAQKQKERLACAKAEEVGERFVRDAQTFSRLTQAVMRAHLEECGFHQHKRGAWRKQRANPTTMNKLERMAKEQQISFNIEAQIDKAQNGDAAAAAQLWRQFKDFPELRAQIVNDWGDMARQSRLALVEQMFGKDELAKVATQAKMLDMMGSIAGSSASPLEMLLTERIVLCWLSLTYFETMYAQRLGELSLAQSVSQQKRIDGAHKRFLESIKALAVVRKLKLPTVQVNVAQNQVNVG